MAVREGDGVGIELGGAGPELHAGGRDGGEGELRHGEISAQVRAERE